MLQNLLLTNLFLIANSLITISFILFAFLYLDLYSNTKKKYTFYIGLGGILMALSFVGNVVLEITSWMFLQEYMLLILQFLGLLSIAFGYGKEVITIFPEEREKGTKFNLAFLPPLPLLFLVNFVLCAFITSKNMRKVRYGKSSEFKPLLYFWGLMTFVLFLNFIAFLSEGRFPILEIALSKYSLIWIVLQFSLLVAFVFMYKWIRLFLSFRDFAKIVFDVWSFSVVLCILITSLFLITNIPSYEREISQALRNNGNMVEFNINQIKSSNQNILRTVISNEKILTDFVNKDIVSLENQLRFLSTESSNLDRIILIDSNGEVVYSSENVEIMEDVVDSNVLIQNALEKKEEQGDFFIEKKGSIAQGLVYQTVQPIFKEGQFLGIIVGIKNLGYEFLKSVNEYTNQEILLLDESDMVLSSVLNSQVILFDDTVRIANTKELDEYGSVLMEINNRAYLGSIIEIENRFNQKVANLIVLNSYEIATSAIQNSMYITSFYALVFSLLSFIPSYFLATRIKKENV